MGRLTTGCVLWFFFTLIGCSDIGDVLYTDPEGVIVRVGASSLVITNKTAQAISVSLVEQETDTRMDWIPTCNAAHTIKQGASVERPYAGIEGYSPGCIILVTWWGCTPTFDGHIRRLTVKTEN